MKNCLYVNYACLAFRRISEKCVSFYLRCTSDARYRLAELRSEVQLAVSHILISTLTHHSLDGLVLANRITERLLLHIYLVHLHLIDHGG